MAWVVVVLLRQWDDQLKIGLPWMEVHITSLILIEKLEEKTKKST